MEYRGLEHHPGGTKLPQNRLTSQEIRCVPAATRTQVSGKLERYPGDVNQTSYAMPSHLEVAVAAFVSYDNYLRHH